MSRVVPASKSTAESVLNWWKGDPSTLKLLSDSGNTIYSFNDNAGTPRILRMSYTGFRTFDEVRAELDFLKHLEREGLKVAASVLSTNGRGVIASSSNEYWCSVFEQIDGFEMKPDGDHWDEAFFKSWGAHIGQLHRASQTFTLAQFAPQLWHWHQDLLYRMADELLPKDDKVGRLAFNRVMHECRALKRTADSYGLIHGEFTPHHFRYHPMVGELIPFGFRNACYNWFLADVVGAFSAVRSLPNAAEIERAILAGYQTVFELSPAEIDSIEVLRRQRALYIYLDRLYWPGAEPNDVEKGKIKLARAYLEKVAGG